MLLKQLDYFIKVVEYRSFTKAAAAAYISQSAISQQIQALENSLGVQLLERHNRSFSLTSAGEYLYRPGLTGIGGSIRSGDDHRWPASDFAPDGRLLT